MPQKKAEPKQEEKKEEAKEVEERSEGESVEEEDILDRLLKEPKLLETKIKFKGFTKKWQLPPNLTFETNQEKKLFEIIYNWGQNINHELEKEKEELVATHAKELDEMRNAVNELEQEVSDQNAELEKVMEELEHYFLQSREQSKMLEEHVNLQERTTALIANSLS